jgi:hypothetical protein
VPHEDRYLAGGAAMHFAPNSSRYSDDIDFFHDSEPRVAAAFAADRERLDEAGYSVQIEQSLPGFIRAVVQKGEDATRVDWAHDSAWRFMPLVRDEFGVLHPVDLAINKVLAVAGTGNAYCTYFENSSGAGFVCDVVRESSDAWMVENLDLAKR